MPDDAPMITAVRPGSLLMALRCVGSRDQPTLTDHHRRVVERLARRRGTRAIAHFDRGQHLIGAQAARHAGQRAARAAPEPNMSPASFSASTQPSV